MAEIKDIIKAHLDDKEEIKRLIRIECEKAFPGILFRDTSPVHVSFKHGTATFSQWYWKDDIEQDECPTFDFRDLTDEEIISIVRAKDVSIEIGRFIRQKIFGTEAENDGIEND